MLSYIDNVIAPFVDSVREDLAVGKDQAALAIFDHFKGQLTPKVTQCLEKNNIQSVLVLPCCTDRLQPLDISVNKAAESFLTSKFQNWYAYQVTQQYNATAHDEELKASDKLRYVQNQLSLPQFK